MKTGQRRLLSDSPHRATRLLTAPNRLTLVLVRHGQAGGVPVDGWVGPSLTALGRRQAKRIAQRLAGERLDYIYCSDMARAGQTCEAIRQHHAAVPWFVDRDISEVHPSHVRNVALPRTPGHRTLIIGERARVDRFIQRLKRRHRAGQTVLIVAHSGLIQLLISRLAGIPSRRGLPLGINNTSISIVNVGDNGDLELMLVNCTRHLRLCQIT